MELILGIIIGVIVGLLLGRRLFRTHIVGDLRIDRSDPTSEPFLFLEIGTDVNTLSTMREATFKVLNKNFLPHK